MQNRSMQAAEEFNLRMALDQYGERSVGHGHTLYTDPFAIPSYFHPTYEVARDQVRFNARAKIAGFDLSDFTELDELYDLMVAIDYQRNTQLSYEALSFRNKPRNTPSKVHSFQLEVCFKLRGKGGKLYYYKRSSNENGMVNGTISHGISFWEDIGYLKPKEMSKWKLTARNAEFFDLELPEISDFQSTLSANEIKVLRLVARGLGSREVGEMLKISKHTVDTHRRNMLRKLEVANTPHLIDLAREMNLI